MLIIKKLIPYIVIPYLSILLYMYVQQDSFVFFPKKYSYEILEEFSKSNDLTIEKFNYDSNSSSNFLYKEAKENQPTILFFNGNSGTIKGALYKLKPFLDNGYGVAINIYRGYGPNNGNPSQENFYNDSLKIYDKLISMGVKEKDIISYGFSIGSSSAIYLASQKNNIKALILEAGFNDLEDVTQRKYWFLPVKVLLKNKFPSDEYIHLVKAPKLYIHGDKDQIILIKFAKLLYEKAPEPKAFITIKNGNHNNLDNFGITENIMNFIDNLK